MTIPILIAEDDPDQSEMLRDTLTHYGYRVDTTDRGDVALRKLKDENYALGILDVRMPGLTGSKVLRRLRSECPDEHVPIIMVSAFATEKDMLRFLEDGADVALAKPFRFDELLEQIQALVPIS